MNTDASVQEMLEEALMRARVGTYKYREWNATSYAHLVGVMAGFSLDGDQVEGPSNPRPSALTRSLAIELAELALASTPRWLEWIVYGARMRHARKATRWAVYYCRYYGPFDQPAIDHFRERFGSVN